MRAEASCLPRRRGSQRQHLVACAGLLRMMRETGCTDGMRTSFEHRIEDAPVERSGRSRFERALPGAARQLVTERDRIRREHDHPGACAFGDLSDLIAEKLVDEPPLRTTGDDGDDVEQAA